MTHDPEHVRASDAERDRIAERLHEALTEGRLTPEEHSERLDAVYHAKTVGELTPLVRDLPESDAPPGDPATGLTVSSEQAREPAGSSEGRENIVAVFGEAKRNGRWLVEPRTNVSVLCGEVKLDLREAVLAQREVVIQCAVVLGGLDITVPHGVCVVNGTSGIFGGTSLRGTDAVTDPHAPTIRLTGTCLFGGIDVRPKAPKKHHDR